jgi:hypothetical protein
MRAMNEVSLLLFRAGHIPITGEALALPLVEIAGSQQIGDEIFNEIMHPLGRALVVRCDACLRIGGPSQGPMKWLPLHKRMVGRSFFALKMSPK